jgi:hypothetical protein
MGISIFSSKNDERFSEEVLSLTNTINQKTGTKLSQLVRLKILKMKCTEGMFARKRFPKTTKLLEELPQAIKNTIK